MSATTWDSLIGYSLEEAQAILEEEKVEYELQFTAAPGKRISIEEARVIAVQKGEKVVLICAPPDWTVA